MASLDEHAIARKLNCTAVEDVILAGQQILMSLQSGEGDTILPGVNEAYVNSLFSNVGQQWNTVLTLYIPDDTSKEEDIRQVIQTLGACVYTVITTGSYAKLASQAAIEALLPPAFQLLSHEFLEKFLKVSFSTIQPTSVEGTIAEKKDRIFTSDVLPDTFLNGIIDIIIISIILSSILIDVCLLCSHL